MKKVCLAVTMAALLAFGGASVASAYEAFKGPLGLLSNKAEKTYKGYTLVTPMDSPLTYLIDMQGNLVHQWKSELLGMYAELLPNGNLLRHSRLPKPPTDFGGECGVLEEFDWAGKKVWEFRLFSDTSMTHHAFDRMPNGNTLILGWEYKSYEEAIAKGRDIKKPGNKLIPEGLRNSNRPSEPTKGMWPDYVMEVNHDGKIVWEWHVWDHVGTGEDQLDINYFLPPANNPLYAGPDWTHFNSVRYNAKTDQVLLNSRNFGEFFVVDKKTGKIVYRWGNPGSHGKGKLPGGYQDDGDQILFGPHDANWLPNGNISVFDNGTSRPSDAYSRVVEMDPKTGEIVWSYRAKLPRFMANSFYSSYQSSAQKLENGSWLVTSTWGGHIFEVTEKKEVVWEMINPVNMEKAYCSVDEVTMPFTVHRAFRYAPDYSGLKGHDLTPMGPLAPGCPNWVDLLNKGQFVRGEK